MARKILEYLIAEQKSHNYLTNIQPLYVRDIPNRGSFGHAVTTNDKKYCSTLSFSSKKLLYLGPVKNVCKAHANNNVDFLNESDKVVKEANVLCFLWDYSHQSYDSFELVKIPYKKGKDGNILSMFIFLPRERDGLPKLLHKASTQPGFFRQHFKPESWSWDVFWIPKFKFTYDTASEPETLSNMGELTEMIDTKGSPSFVSKIIQKAVIEEDEGGTKAAAVTDESEEEDMGFCLNYEPPPAYEFVADHPFLFMVREEKSGSVLFSGTVLNPLLQE